MLVFGPSWEHHEYNACIGYTRDSLETACRGYCRQVEINLERVLRTRNDLDVLFLPTMSAWRHYLELRLKQLLLHAAKIDDEEATIDGTHSLSFLWKKARAMLVERFPDEPHDQELVQVDEHIAELDTIDPKSMTFRYTIDKQRAPLLPDELTHFGYVEFCAVVKSVRLTLEGAFCMVEQVRDHMAELRADAHAEARGAARENTRRRDALPVTGQRHRALPRVQLGRVADAARHDRTVSVRT
jgi:hypothetical protein